MLRRFTLIRVHVDERPRIESTSTSSTAKYFATLRCLCFHLSKPANAASLLGEFAITNNGIRCRAGFFFAATRAGEAALFADGAAFAEEAAFADGAAFADKAAFADGVAFADE